MPQGIVVRLPNWLGDTVMAVPTVRALRAAFPDDRLVLAGPWAPLLVGQGLADVLVAYPRSWSGRLRAADHVRALGAGLAVLLPNSLEAALAARYWRAHRRLGFAADGRSWLLTDQVPVPRPRRHQVDEYLALIEAIGITPSAREPHLTPPSPDSLERQQARALLGDAGVETGARPLVGVHLGAEYGPAKRWTLPRIIELCGALRDEGADAVLMGAPGDTALAEQVMAATTAPSLVGRDRPESLPAVLSEISVLVSGDTGVAHLAAALGTPAVTLFGPTDPARSAARGPVRTLRHVVPCTPCLYRVCPIEHPCMTGITVPDVLASVRAVLAGSVVSPGNAAASSTSSV